MRFHRVETPAYPLFREPQYALSLSNSIVQVARAHELDIVHAHYAVPHAAAAYLARQILAAGAAAGGSDAPHVPKVITTLHGTDITLVGSDPSYSETVAFCIDQSDGVTAVSESLKADTYRFLPVKSPIEVIPNFLDCAQYRPRPNPELRARLCPPDQYDGLLLHISNFRPVKRLDAVLEVFRRVRDRYRAKLVLAGDGPERARLAQQAAEADLTEHVEILGEQDDVRELLSSRRCVPAAVGAGELRAGRRRSHGLRHAGRRLARRRPAGSHHARRDRVPARPRTTSTAWRPARWRS